MLKPQVRFSTSLMPTLVFMFVLMLGFSYKASAQTTLDGNWQTGEDNSVVQVETLNGVATGKLLSSNNAKAKIGTEILRGFKQVNGVWVGKLYAAKRDKLLDATITPDEDSLNIKVSAGVMSKKLSWKKAKQ